MRRFLLDSNTVSAFIARREPIADRSRDALRRGDRIGTCEPVVTTDSDLNAITGLSVENWMA